MPKGDFQIVRKEYNTKVEEHNIIEFNEEKVKYIMTPLAEEVKKVIEDIKIINTKIKLRHKPNEYIILYTIGCLFSFSKFTEFCSSKVNKLRKIAPNNIKII